MMHRLSMIAVGASLMLASACGEVAPAAGSDAGTSGTDAATPRHDGGSAPDDAMVAAGDAALADAAPVVPEDAAREADSGAGGCLPAELAGAAPLAFGADPASGSLTAAGERDVYVFEGPADTWVRIFVTSTPASDTAVTLYDACGERLAENDDLVLTRDGDLYTRLPDAGTYHVVVQEGATLRGSGTSSAPFDYELRVGAVDASLSMHDLDSEPNDSLAGAQRLSFVATRLDTSAWPNERLIAAGIERREVDYAVVLGTFDDGSEDHFVFRTVGTDSRLSGWAIDVLAHGPSGTGGPDEMRVYYTPPPGRIGDGHVDDASPFRAVSPWFGDYGLSVDDLSGARGPGAYYVFVVLRVDPL